MADLVHLMADNLRDDLVRCHTAGERRLSSAYLSNPVAIVVEVHGVCPHSPTQDAPFPYLDAPLFHTCASLNS
jgi:hypothetical protein